LLILRRFALLVDWQEREEEMRDGAQTTKER